jgi:hypothetical protein
LVWLGGSADEVTLPADWTTRIGAVGAVRSFQSEVIEQPIRRFRDVKIRLHDVDPEVLAVWTPYAGAAPYDQFVSGAVVSLEEPLFDDALLLLRMELDALPASSEIAEAPPASWGEFDARLSELEHDGFAITPQARADLGGGYADTERMWEHLAALSRAGREFHERDGKLGQRLTDWVRGRFHIEVALHDDALSGSVEFSFEGATYHCEPHVKVDDAKPLIECGRIYFAVDGENQRFIVNHVGVHL